MMGPVAAPRPTPATHPVAPVRFYGWVVLAASVALVMVGAGVTFSLAIFLKPLEESFGWSRGLISGIALVNWLVFGAGSFGWGALSDRIGVRRVAVGGAALLGIALALSSGVTQAWQLYAAFGLAGAAGASAFYVPLSATATRWFTARRGLALGLLNSGMGLGIMVVPPLARVLITVLGWRLTFAVFAGLTWLVAGVATRHLHDRPADLGLRPYGEAGQASPDPAPRGPRGAGPRGSGSPAILAEPAFWVLALTHFACCAAHSGPIFHMAAHALDLGVSRLAAALMLGVSGATSIAGRIGSGLLADRLGARRALIAMLAVQALTLSGYLVADGEGGLFGLALAFGVAYGGAMPLYVLAARECFSEAVVGTAFGGIFFVSCVGMGLGAAAGGWVFDRLGSYWGLLVLGAPPGQHPGGGRGGGRRARPPARGRPRARADLNRGHPGGCGSPPARPARAGGPASWRGYARVR